MTQESIESGKNERMIYLARFQSTDSLHDNLPESLPDLTAEIAASSENRVNGAHSLNGYYVI